MAARSYAARGTDAPWYKPRDLSEDQRAAFRLTTLEAQEAKRRAIRGEGLPPQHEVNEPRLQTETLMPVLRQHGLRALSLFSGGGGLDIGFHRAGYSHIASYELLTVASATLARAMPEWTVFGGALGDVTQVDWSTYRGKVDVLHGGPPCQPFSHAGRRQGSNDARDMIPELVRAVRDIEPEVFVCENVGGLLTKRFEDYVRNTIIAPLADRYIINQFVLEAADFGVPQRRRRVFFVGFKNVAAGMRFQAPPATHKHRPGDDRLLPSTMGAREALGLSDIGRDGLAPTLRSGFTGPRHTTSVVNSASALRHWAELGIWPNGVAATRQEASAYVPKNGHFRLSVPDCLVLQGFPKDWPVGKPVYAALGLIGNSVAPPMSYHLAQAIQRALL